MGPSMGALWIISVKGLLRYDWSPVRLPVWWSEVFGAEPDAI